MEHVLLVLVVFNLLKEFIHETSQNESVSFEASVQPQCVKDSLEEPGRCTDAWRYPAVKCRVSRP